MRTTKNPSSSYIERVIFFIVCLCDTNDDCEKFFSLIFCSHDQRVKVCDVGDGKKLPKISAAFQKRHWAVENLLDRGR